MANMLEGSPSMEFLFTDTLLTVSCDLIKQRKARKTCFSHILKIQIVLTVYLMLTVAKVDLLLYLKLAHIK